MMVVKHLDRLIRRDDVHKEGDLYVLNE